MNGASILASVVLAIAGLACAAHHQPPVFTDRVLEYPAPDAEACGITEPGMRRLTVTVKDDAGALFPNTPVYIGSDELGGGSGAPPVVVATRTNQSGVATLEVPGDNGFHTYTVTVALAGFMPEVRALRLRAGCAGTLVVVLRVASTEALNANRATAKK